MAWTRGLPDPVSCRHKEVGMIFVGVDPGKTTGYAVFEDDMPIVFGEVKFEELDDWLDTMAGMKVELYVVEAYVIRPAHLQSSGYAHQWNKGEALQIIGMIKRESRIRGLPHPVMQQPSIKPMGYRLLGKEYKKGKKKQHIQDALAHAQYFLHREKNPIG